MPPSTATKRLLTESFIRVRSQTMEIVAPLEIEDYVVQTAPFMSPPRWHLGHTTWFFEMLLKEFAPGYKVYSDEYLYYFNSYYEKFGSRINKDSRGTRSRPTVRETLAYRDYIDERMRGLLSNLDGHPRSSRAHSLIRLGIEHEMQHQELLVYDIKHLLGDDYFPARTDVPPASSAVSGVARVEGGLFHLGYSGPEFSFDNEKPSHLVYLEDYEIDRAPVTNGQYLEFMEDGGYADHRWWHSEGWAAVNSEGWQAPLYWERRGDDWMIRDFSGLHVGADAADEPVCHVSFYEAHAYSNWAGKRLPTEAEWEKAAAFDPNTNRKLRFPWGDDPPDAEKSNLLDNRVWGVAPVGSFPEGQSAYGCYQMVGDVWEWTTSDYAPYPGFVSDFEEYNDKWFVGQKVLRGGSFATPRDHIRATYRNFFHPEERWMIAGFRCATSR